MQLAQPLSATTRVSGKDSEMLDEFSWGPRALRDFMGRSCAPPAQQSWTVVGTPGSAQPQQQGSVNPHPKQPSPHPWHRAPQAGHPHSLTGAQKQEHKWVRAELSTHLGTHGCRNFPTAAGGKEGLPALLWNLLAPAPLTSTGHHLERHLSDRGTNKSLLGERLLLFYGRCYFLPIVTFN